MSWDDTYLSGRHLLAVLSDGTLTVCDIGRKIALQSFDDMPLNGIVKFSASSDHLCIFSSAGFYLLDPAIKVHESAGVVLRWSEPKLLEAFLEAECVESAGFAYPFVGVATKDEAQVHVFDEFHNKEANEMHFRAFKVLQKNLSGTAKCLLSFSASGNFVAINEKRETFIYALPRKVGGHVQRIELKQYSFANHPGTVAKLSWRPDGYEYRELLLVVMHDRSSEVYSFLHEHTHPTDAVQTADLVAQITDFTGAPSAFTWVRHEPVPSTDSVVRKVSLKGPPGDTASKDLTDPANPSSIRGAWLIGVGTDRIVRLWCLHPGRAGGLQCRSCACGLMCVNIVGVDTTELVVHADETTESIPQSALVQLRNLRAVGYFHLSGAGKPTKITCISEAHLFERDASSNAGSSFFDRSYPTTTATLDTKPPKEVQLLVSDMTSMTLPDPGVVFLEEVELTQMGILQHTHEKRVCITHLPELCFCSGPYPSLVFDAWSPAGDRTTVMLQPQVLMSMDQPVQWSNMLTHLTMCAEDVSTEEINSDSKSDGHSSPNIYSGHAVCRSLPYHHPSKIKLVCQSLVDQPYLEFKWVSFSQARIEMATQVAAPTNVGASLRERTSLFNDSIGLLLVGNSIHLLCLNLSDHAQQEETVEIPFKYLPNMSSHTEAQATDGQWNVQTQLDQDWINVDELKDGSHEVVVFPDPQHGVGLRLRLVGNDIVIGGFKMHPTTGAPLPAEATGAIHTGDQLLAVNGISVEGGKLDDAVQLIRSFRASAQRSQVTLRIKSSQQRKSMKLRQASGIVSARWFLDSLATAANEEVNAADPIALFQVERPTYWSILGRMQLDSPIECYDVKPLVGDSPSQPRLVLVSAERTNRGFQLVVHLASAVPFEHTATHSEYFLDEAPTDIQIQLLGELHARAYVCMQGGNVSVYSIRIGDNDVRFEHSITVASNRISSHRLSGDQSRVAAQAEKVFLGSYISSSALPEMFHLHADIVQKELIVERVGAQSVRQQAVSTLHTPFHGFPGWCSRNADTLVVGGYGHIVSWRISTGEYSGNIECVSGPFRVPPFMYSELTNSCLKAPSPWSSFGLRYDSVASYQGGMPDWHPLHLCAVLFIQCEQNIAGAGISRCVNVLHKLNQLLQDCADETALNEIFPIVLDIGFNEQSNLKQGAPNGHQSEPAKQSALQALRQAVEPIVQQYFSVGGVRSVLQGEVQRLPQPLQTLTVPSLAVLCAIATSLVDHLLPMTVSGPTSAVPQWKDLDVAARHVIKGYVICNELYRLYIRHRITAERAQFLKMPPTLWLSAMISTTQKELLDALFYYMASVRQQSLVLTVEEADEVEDDERNQSTPQSAKFKSTLFDDLTVLAVPFWYRGMDELRAVIQDDANMTFKATRKVMDILSHYVFLGSVDKLTRLAKTDSSISGVQLAKLLSFDFASERGRGAAQKNAFALLRKQQYLEAAAVFLLASPPLLNDATRVLEKNLADPTLALLVARLLEPNTLEVKQGAVLGPRAREIITTSPPEAPLRQHTPNEFQGLMIGEDQLWVPAAHKLVTALWCQDTKSVDDAATAIADCITVVSDRSPEPWVRSLFDLMQLLTAELVVFPLSQVTASLEVREKTLKNMAGLLQSKGISTDLALLIPSITRRDTRSASELDPFRLFCREQAEKQAGPRSVHSTPAKQSSGRGFNFANTTASAPSTPATNVPSMLGDFDFPGSQQAAPTPNSADIFADFGYTPPPRAAPAPAAAPDIFGDYDYVPPPSAAPSFNFARAPPMNGGASAPASDIFADFDTPHAPPTPQKSIFDDFEPAVAVPTQPIAEKRAVAEPTMSEHVRLFTRLDDASLPAVVQIANTTVVESLSTIGYDVRQRCLQELLYSLRVIDVKHPFMVRADLHRLLHVVIEHAAFSLGPHYLAEAFQVNINDLAQRFRDYLVFLQAKSGPMQDEYQTDQLVVWLCEDLVWWLGDTGRQTYPIIMVCLYSQLGEQGLYEEIIVATSVKLMQTLRPGLMDLMNGAGEASELIFRAERLRALSLASQLQKAIALHLVGDLELHHTTLDLACAAVRSALMFAAIGCEYDIVHKILKHHPTKTAGSGAAETKAEQSDRSLKWRYVRDVTRHKAEEMLQGTKKGTFLLRPWTDKDAPDSAYGLSFSNGTEVKHAIIRVESDTDGSVTYKCGRLGPFSSLHELLSIISTILSCGLVFSEANYPPTADGKPLGKEPDWATLDAVKEAAKEVQRPDPNWAQKDPNRELWNSLRRLMAYSLKTNWEAQQHAENRSYMPTLSSSSFVEDDPDEEAYEGVLDRGILSVELRTVMNLLVLKAFYKQLLGIFNMQFPDHLPSVVAGILAINGKWPRGCSRFEGSPPPKKDVATILLSSLNRLIQTTESALLHGLCPRLQPTPVERDETLGYDTYLKELLNPHSGVARRYVQVKSSENADQEQADMWMLCFSADDAAEWLVSNKKLPDTENAHQMLQASADSNMLQRVNVQGSDRVQYHYLNEWAASVADNALHHTVLMGRHWYGPVRAFGASNVITDIVGEWQLGPAGTARQQAFMLTSWRRPCPYWSNAFLANPAAGASSLWDSLRGEGWLVSMLTRAFPPEDRDWGLVDKSEALSRSGEDTFQKSVWLHCYRNALLRRLYLPHRFVAFLEIELLELKNLSPNFKPHPMEVLACVGLSDDASPESRKLSPRPGATDFVTTPEKKLWAMPASPVRYPQQSGTAATPVVGTQSASHAWRERALLKFPLLDETSPDGPVASFEAPPQSLHISIFEKKGFFGDQRLGDAVIDLADLSDTKPFTKFVGLSLDNTNYTYWFINVEVTLRFSLMAIDEEKELESRAIRLTTKRKRKFSAPHFHFRQNTRSNLTLEVFDRRSAMFRRQTVQGDAPDRRRTLRYESDVSDNERPQKLRNPFRRRLGRSDQARQARDDSTAPAVSKRPEKIGTSKVPTAAAMMKDSR